MCRRINTIYSIEAKDLRPLSAELPLPVATGIKLRMEACKTKNELKKKYPLHQFRIVTYTTHRNEGKWEK